MGFRGLGEVRYLLHLTFSDFQRAQKSRDMCWPECLLCFWHPLAGLLFLLECAFRLSCCGLPCHSFCPSSISLNLLGTTPLLHLDNRNVCILAACC